MSLRHRLHENQAHAEDLIHSLRNGGGERLQEYFKKGWPGDEG